MLAPAFALLALATAAPLPRAAIVVRATGFTEADAAKLDEKINAEVAARGFEAQRMDDADAACLSARACARDLVRNAGAVALVRVDLVRGGGNVQIAAVVFDDEGRASDEVTGLARLTALLSGDAVLPAAFLPVLVATKPQVAAPDDPPITHEATPVITPETKPASPPTTTGEPSEAQPLSGVALAAIGGIGVGALAMAVGAVGATGQVSVARDPTALGPDKERAAVLVPVLVVVAAAGAALAGASGWVLVGELE